MFPTEPHRCSRPQTPNIILIFVYITGNLGILPRHPVAFGIPAMPLFVQFPLVREEKQRGEGDEPDSAAGYEDCG